jgi:signal transduction histidine kinase
LPDFEARLDKVKAELIAETGVGISILLALLTWLLVRGRARALQAADELEMRVQERTHDLAATATQLEQEIQARKQLERSILEISEEEQARIGRELHDDLGQLLTGAAYLAGALSSSLARTDQGSSQQAGEIKKIMQDAIKRTRYISHGLIPFNIASQGLQQGLAQLANDVATLSGIPCEVSFSGSTEVSDSMIAIHLYRIAQEAINNAVKHISAHKLSIVLSANADEIRLTIADDGVGLPEQLQGASAGVGLMNMKYRAQIIGASITLEAQQGKGTRVLLVLPLGNS